MAHRIAGMNTTPCPHLVAVFCLGALLASSLPARAQALTARQVVDRIKANVGVPWSEQTVDTIKAGEPDTPVDGIAVTMMATLDVLERAAAAGHNMVITHEPTFYDHLDPTDGLVGEKDPVTAAKLKFIKGWEFVYMVDAGMPPIKAATIVGRDRPANGEGDRDRRGGQVRGPGRRARRPDRRHQGDGQGELRHEGRRDLQTIARRP